MANNPTVQYELEYMRARLDILQDYLLSDDLYWTIRARPPGGEPSFPQMTISNLLLTNARLSARSLSRNETIEHTNLDEELGRVKQQWRVAWERKANKEFSSRMKLWGNFIDEYRKDPENQYDRYAYEVGRRVMLELLSPSITDAVFAERELLQTLDAILRAVHRPGEFIWEDVLKKGFSRDTYWYLYGRLPEKASP